MQAYKYCHLVATMVLLMHATASELTAAPVTLNATADLWVRQANAGAVYENDGMLVDPVGDGAVNGQRVALLQFDLSGISGEITAAHIELRNRGGDFATPGAEQRAYSVAVGSGLAGINWNTYAATVQPTESAFGALGHYLVAGAQLPSGPTDFSASDSATAADLVLLNAIRTSGSPQLGISMKAVAGKFYWDDSDPFDQIAPPRLVLEVVPEPAAVALIAPLAMLLRRRHRA